MRYTKSIKDIYSVDIKCGEMHVIFNRINETQFKQSYSMEGSKFNICEKCGDCVYEEQDHSQCEYNIVDELYVAQEMHNMLEDDEENVIEINKNRDDCIYISLGM